MKSMSPAQAARVHPMRGESAPMPDADAGGRRLALFLNSPLPGTKGTMLDTWKHGIEHAEASHAAHMRAAIETFENQAPAKDPAVEAVMLWMLDYWSRRGLVIKDAQGGGNDRYYPVDAWFVRRWQAAGGIPFALRVLEAFPKLDFGVDTTPKAHAQFIKPRAGELKWWCLEVGHLGLLHVLRRAIAIAPDYAKGVAEAERVREQAPLFMRGALAFAFPDEPFCKTDLRFATPTKKGARVSPEAWGLVTTSIDADQLAPILDSMARDSQPFATDTALYGYTLVKRLGDEAAPHLISYLSIVKGEYPKEHFGEALALTETPETAAFFASKAKDKVFGKLAKAYVKNA
ncbi:MAG: hypothetical protein M4D80_30510 [Myxococcota bacterium]|nr:hypothetical protein [Myxococcota bacterium]